MKGYISIILAGVCLAIVGTLVKLIGGSIPVLTIAFFRAAIAAAFLLIVLPFFDRSIFKVSRQDLKNYIIMGLLMALNFASFISANALAPVSNVILLAYTFPFWLAIISHFFLKEKVSGFVIVCLAIAFAGIFIMNPFMGSAYTGNMFALFQAVIYAVLFAYMRYVDKRHHIGVVFWFILFAAIFLSPAPLIYGLGTVSWNYVWIIILGVVGTGMAYIFLNYGLEKLQAETSSIIIMTTEPIVAIVVAILAIGEVLALNVVAGGILIIAAGLLLEKKYKLTKR